PALMTSRFARQFPQLFPANASGPPPPAASASQADTGDQIATLVDLRANPGRVPQDLSLRTLNAGGIGPAGEGKYMMNRYLRERGDANIKSNADLITKARLYTDPHFPHPNQPPDHTHPATLLA